MAEFDPLRQGVTGRQAYFLDVPGTDSAAALSVVSFKATEKMGAPTEVTIELTHPLQLTRADYLNLDACFSIKADAGVVKKFSGYIERFSTVQTTKDFTKYEITLKSHFGRLQAVTNTEVYQHLTIPQIIQKILRRHGIQDHGACQDTCRLSHAAKGCLWVACEAIVTTDSRSGLRVTAPMGVQSRVQPDQRAGLRSRAWTYTS